MEGMMEVYLVKSGQLVDFVGWEWTNLAVFDNNDAAVAFARKTEAQIAPEDLDEKESVEIEAFTLKSW
jgi:hypothetical protein